MAIFPCEYSGRASRIVQEALARVSKEQAQKQSSILSPLRQKLTDAAWEVRGYLENRLDPVRQLERRLGTYEQRGREKDVPTRDEVKRMREISEVLKRADEPSQVRVDQSAGMSR